MALVKVNFTSESLRKMSTLTVILPERFPARAKLPVLYLLHGYSDDDSAWTRRTSIERYASAYPLVVVMPDGGLSFYCDAPGGPAGESHFIKDVIGFTERSFPVGRSREYRALGGLSMGGYGSMKFALKYPHMFASVFSHSSSFDFAHRADLYRADFNQEFAPLIGPVIPGGPQDLFAMASRLKPKDAPAIAFDCGLDDVILCSSRSFHRHLAKLRIRHTYKEHPGAHNWDYWDLHVQDALKFHAKHLKFPK